MSETKVILITGASSGIGEACARRLGGHKLVLAARRADRLEALAAELGESSVAATLDVTDRAAFTALVKETVDRWGQIDVLINNAGLMPLSFMANCQVDEWDRMVDVNIKGVLNGVAAALPCFLAQGSGHFINVASVAGIQVFPTGGVYCATKHAVRALSEGLRQESRGKYRVTTISPGVIQTELTRTITDPKAQVGIEKSYQGALQPDAIANAVAWAIEQPAEVDVNEIVVRPKTQS